MRIAPRLVLSSGLAIAVVMTAYGLISLRERSLLISDALIRETETLAHAMQIVANDDIRDDEIANLDRVLERVVEDPDMYVAAVLDARGRLLAGGPRSALACLAGVLPGSGPLQELHVWAECDGRIRLVALPVLPPGQSLVLARRATVVERDMATSRRRILVTTVALAALAALAILLVLRRTLSRPLAAIMRGVRMTGGPNPPPPIRIPRSSGELRDLAVAFNEMTERLEGKRQSLIREVEERIDLERRLRHAETFAALGRVTGGLAHELGSPLNVIGVRAEAIQHDRSAPPELRRQAEEIVREVDRVAELVRGLIQFARREPVRRQPVDLTDLLRSVASEVQPRTGEAGAEVELRTPDRPVTVPGDATLLRHAVSNVLLNAVQAVAGAEGERRVRMALEPAGEVARIVVEDTGPGISPEDYPRLFEPFFTTKDVGEGTGLGLSIALGIIEEHGGVLTLVPRKSGGIRVTIDLPMEWDE